MNESVCAPGSLLDQDNVRWPLLVAYSVVFVCCFVGNLFLFAIVVSQRAMRTATNFFLANLAVVDFLVAIFCIIQNMGHLLLFEGAGWPLGSALCFLYIFVLQFVPSISAGLLVLVSVEKYIALRHPLWARKILTNKLRLALTLIVWLIAIIANIPFLFMTNYFEIGGHGICASNPGSLLLKIRFVIWFCIPVLVMAFLYTSIGYMLWTSTSGLLGDRPGSEICREHTSDLTTFERGSGLRASVRHKFSRMSLRSQKKTSNDFNTRSFSSESTPGHTSKPPAVHKGQSFTSTCSPSIAEIVSESRRKVVRLLFAVVLSFAVLTLPHHVRLLWRHSQPPGYHFCNSSYIALVQPITYLLLFANSGINPFLYAFMSQRFRVACAQLICGSTGAGTTHVVARRNSFITTNQDRDIAEANEDGVLATAL